VTEKLASLLVYCFRNRFEITESS